MRYRLTLEAIENGVIVESRCEATGEFDVGRQRVPDLEIGLMMARLLEMTPRPLSILSNAICETDEVAVYGGPQDADIRIAAQSYIDAWDEFDTANFHGVT